MSEQEKQESQKTVVAFIAGLLIGGLLVWVFSGPSQSEEKMMDDHSDDEMSEMLDNDSDSADESSDATDVNNNEDNTPAPVADLPVGDGEVSVADQAAGLSVSLAGATFPSDEGWIGVRDYVDGQMTGLLGVVRYSKEQGLVPEEIVLQRATVPGSTYAVVFYTENGDRVFNLAEDVQVNGVLDVFVAK